ncbi:hypothetical protein HDU81_011138 [Chytriomyces hyalinus]|nr:hypothetical protein HDU81_011138 [Chytriomyces hyalinus]
MTSNRFAGLFATLKPQTPQAAASVSFIPSTKHVLESKPAATPAASSVPHSILQTASQPIHKTVQINLAQQLVQNVFLSKPVVSDTEDGEIQEASVELSNNEHKRSFEQVEQPQQEQQPQQPQQPDVSKPKSKKRKQKHKSKKAKLDSNGAVSLDAPTSSTSSQPSTSNNNPNANSNINSISNSNATSPHQPDQKKKEAPKRPYRSYICCVCGLAGVHFYHDCDNPNGAPPDKSYLCRICKVPGHHVKWCPKKTEYFAPKQANNPTQQQQQHPDQQQQPIQNHQWRDRQMFQDQTQGQQRQERYPEYQHHLKQEFQKHNVRNQQIWDQRDFRDHQLLNQQARDQQIQQTEDEIPQEPETPEEDNIRETIAAAQKFNPELVSSESYTSMYSHPKNETDEFKHETHESTHNSSMFNPFAAGSFNYNYNYNPEPSKIAPAFDPSEYTQKFTASATASASYDPPINHPNVEPSAASNDPATNSTWNPSTSTNNEVPQKPAQQPTIDQKHQQIASKPFCRYARNGKCRNPTTCRFNHDKSLEPCIFLNILGGCRNGFHCEYSHADIGDEARRVIEKERGAYQERKKKEKVVWDMVKAGWISSEHAKEHFGIDLSSEDLASLNHGDGVSNGVSGDGKGVPKQRVEQELEVPPWFQGINLGSRSDDNARVMGSQGFGGF